MVPPCTICPCLRACATAWPTSATRPLSTRSTDDDPGRRPLRRRRRRGPRAGYSGIWSTARPARRPSFTKRIDPVNRQGVLCAVVLAAIVGLITHWPVGAAIGGAIGWTLRSALEPSTSRRVVDRLEALATWIEALRDSVAAHRGLLAAIESTEPSAPPAIKAPVARLIVRIKSGTPLDAALDAFAAELGDAAADEAIAPLILAARFGGSDLGGLLATRQRIPRANRAVAAHRGGPVQPGATCAW